LETSSGRIAILDCSAAGASGDMILGALLDLGVDVEGFRETMRRAEGLLPGCESLEVRVSDTTRGGFRCKRAEFRLSESVAERRGREVVEAVSTLAGELGLSSEARGLALNSARTLVEAEARLHGQSVDDVSLHEAGSIDTALDIVGVAYALEELGLLRDCEIYATPVAVGGGLFTFSHGVFPSPGPAALEILMSKGFPLSGGPVDAELLTPTGAALLVNMARGAVRHYPPMEPRAIGYGAGARELEGLANILRIVVGQRLSSPMLRDMVYVLETNLDDVSGEVLGHALERLLQEGARDVSVIPMFTKKSRPGQIVKVIVDAWDVERLSRVLVEETGTLGVRAMPCERLVLQREIVPLQIELGGVKHIVNVKVSRDMGGKVVAVKPEYEDVKKLAEKAGKPLRIVFEEVSERARSALR